MSGVVVPFRPRCEVPRRAFPVIRTDAPEYVWQGPIPITVEGGVQAFDLIRAIESGGFRVAFDARTFCLIVRAPLP